MDAVRTGTGLNTPPGEPHWIDSRFHRKRGVSVERLARSVNLKVSTPPSTVEVDFTGNPVCHARIDRPPPRREPVNEASTRFTGNVVSQSGGIDRRAVTVRHSSRALSHGFHRKPGVCLYEAVSLFDARRACLVIS